jgi:hypothetical protein
MILVGPPDVRLKGKAEAKAVHEFKVMNAKPRRDTREKFFAIWSGLGDPVSDRLKGMVALTSPKGRE